MIDTQESATAKLCSFARAHHSNYGKQKIFDDYLESRLISLPHLKVKPPAASDGNAAIIRNTTLTAQKKRQKSLRP